MQKNTTRKRRSGNALVEITLMAPWIFFLFIGVFDYAFYAYSVISTENAARAAALLTSRSKLAATDQTDACAVVLTEMTWAAYGRTLPPTCNAAPLIVNTTLLHNTGNDNLDAAQVEVIYTMPLMIPIPGLNPGNQYPNGLRIDRVWQMKIDPTAD